MYIKELGFYHTEGKWYITKMKRLTMLYMEETENTPVVVIKRVPSADKEKLCQTEKVEPKNKKHCQC